MIEKPTSKNHHESNVLIENTVQESFLYQLMGQVKAGDGKWTGDQDQNYPQPHYSHFNRLQGYPRLLLLYLQLILYNVT